MMSREPDLKTPVFDPPARRGPRRTIYMKELNVYVTPIEQGDPRFQPLVELMFPDRQAVEAEGS